MNNGSNREYQINNIINLVKNILKPSNNDTKMDIESEDELEQTDIPMLDRDEDYSVNDDVLFIINEILKINPEFFKIVVKTIKDIIINKKLNLLTVIEKYDVFENLFEDFSSFNGSAKDEFKNLFNLDNFSQLLKFILNIIIADNKNNVDSEVIIENLSKIVDSIINLIKAFNLV
jgi:hypothetical protein